MNRISAGCAVGLCMALEAYARGQVTWSFARIVDFNTPIPGGIGNFTAFGGFAPVPALRNGLIPFVGDGASGQRGAYLADMNGAITLLANRSTPNPGGPGNFTDFGPLAMCGNNPMERMFAIGYQGIYLLTGLVPQLVADTNTPIPSGSGNFAGLSMSFSCDGSSLAFCGLNSAGRLGVYKSVNGVLSRVADANTPIPGRMDLFTNITNFEDISGSEVVFAGFGFTGYGGIFSTAGGFLQTVVDTDTPIPGGSGTFANFGGMSLEAGVLAFKALDGQGHQGIYWTMGGLTAIADINTPIPQGHGLFAGFGFGLFTGPSLSQGNVAFLGSDSTFQEGLYAYFDGALVKVVAPGDVLDGQTVQVVLATQDSLDGDRLAFEAFFTDSTRGLYVATAIRCRADFNHDDTVNSQDFFDFLSAFFAGAPGADFNHDGLVNSQDFFDFLTEFFAGCP